MSNRTHLTPEEACELVDEISESNGYLGKKDRETLSPKARRAINNLQTVVGAATRTLAEGLYRSQARFVFELIQNAEDNNYQSAWKDGQTPYINFSINPDNIIVDCNEDGFTAENVRAICAVQRSTKVREDSQYYIGEKGIGFKSVFMVASKVHIQSGPFSFFFEHQDGDSGMGMISPENQAPTERLVGPLTRMTLTLIKDLDHASLCRQFDALPDTFLLFLNKLKTISIKKVDSAGIVESTQYIRRDDTSAGTITLEKAYRRGSGKTKTERKRYYITRKTLRNLPVDRQRDYNTAEAVIAFPVDDKDIPIIESQQVYAYLPIRDFGFSFLIQSDFVTQASRQDVMESPRNKAVLRGIAEAFVKGVLQLCDHPTLQYQWMRYLPGDIPDPFWRIIRHDIQLLLWGTLVLRPASNGPLKLVKDLRVLEADFKDEHDKPLLPDLPNELYIAPEYTKSDSDILIKTFVLGVLQYSEILDIIEFDLSLPVSRFASKCKDIDWNNRLAKQLLIIYEREAFRKRLRRLAIIPLRDSTWTSITDGPVFFPSAEDIDLPTDLGLKIVESEAAKQPKRLKLFLALGVTEASSDDVRLLIKERYRYQGSQISLGSSICHLEYLYWTHTSDSTIASNTKTSPRSNDFIPKPWRRQLQSDSEWSRMSPGTTKIKFEPTIEFEPNSRTAQMNAFQTITYQTTLQKFSFEELRLTDYGSGVKPRSKHCNESYRWLSIFCDDGQQYSCGTELYIQSDHEFGIQNLVKAVLSKPGADAKKVPGFSVKLIHPSYSSALSQKTKADHLSWKDWMSEFLGISDVPQLDDRSTVGFPSLSGVLLYISEHKSEQLLGMLMAHWKSYERQILPYTCILVSDLKVPSNVSMKRLRETYVPRQRLTDQCAKYIDCDKFPFLILPDNSNLESCGFLEYFKVGLKDDIHFYLSILQSCISSNTIDGVYKLYETIQYKCSSFTDEEKAIKLVRDFFRLNKGILVPGHGNMPSTWKFPVECRWDAPDYLTSSTPLLSKLRGSPSPVLAEFFHKTLDISDVDWNDLIQQLNAFRRIHKVDVDPGQILDIYRRLDNFQKSMDKEQRDANRHHFEIFPVIYILPEKEWRKTNQCVWSSKVNLKGKSLISRQYKDLQEFFVGFLGVEVPNMGMLVRELKKSAASSVPIDEIKSLMWQINSMAPTEKDLKPLEDLTIFPVRSVGGMIELRSKETKFAISDRKRLEELFTTQIEFLDFSLEESRKLQPLLSALELTDRYLSAAVVENSFISNGSKEASETWTNHLRRRAYALFRCAVHFGSPRAKFDDRSLYDTLMKSEIFETDQITTQLEYPPTKACVNVDRGRLHIAENGEAFQIYVPNDPKSHELCYLRLLPTKLWEHIIDSDRSEGFYGGKQTLAISVISDILKSSDLVIDDVLEEAGIVSVPFTDEWSDTSLRGGRGISPTLVISANTPRSPGSVSASPATSRSVTVTSPSATLTPRTFSPSRPSSPQSAGSTSARPIFVFGQARRAPHPFSIFNHTSTHNIDPPQAPFDANSNQTEYRRLLVNVVEAAISKGGSFPSKGAFDLQSLLSALPSSEAEAVNIYDVPFGVRSENQIMHDMRVGAAGELYAFEILSRLEVKLPGFNRQNWASTIRKYVTILDEYRDMEPWKGAETADIVYQDAEGEFTKLLIENGYLDSDLWSNARPKYFLEVKTTTKECATRFFLSKSQFNRMQRMKLNDRTAVDEVYVLLRVFQLDKNEIGMRIFVDPEGMRERRELIFTPESYSVVPRSGL